MRLVMAGTGQAQLFVLKALVDGRIRPGEAILVGAPAYLHPGMVPGWLAGQYEEQEITIDARRLAERAGCRFIDGRVRHVDAAAKAIVLEDDTTEPYDTLSLALGPVPAGLDVPGVSRTVAVCPDGRARHILPAIAEARTAAGSRTMAVAVVGAGASGFEVACALRARLQRETPGASVMVVDASDEVMKDQGPKARRLALSMLERRRIGVALGARVVEVTSRGLCLASGAVAPADFVIWCTGAAPPTAISGSGLALDEAGFAAVDAALRSKSHPDVFVAGGAVSMREGRVLAHNLAVACGSVPGKTFKSYQRRLRAPTLLNAGDGMALLSFGAVAREARWAMRLKDRLDRRWVERFQRLERTTASSA